MAYVAPEEPKKKKQKTGVQFSTCTMPWRVGSVQHNVHYFCNQINILCWCFKRALPSFNYDMRKWARWFNSALDSECFAILLM